MVKNICILVDSLSSGGAEKVASNLSISLSKKGYAITIVSMRKDIDYDYDGTLFNFGLIKGKYNRIKSLLIFKDFFRKSKFDIIIDHRVRSNFWKELLFSKYIFYKQNVIYCIHSYDLNYYFSFLNVPWISVFPHVKRRKFVCVSKEIQKRLKQEINIKSKTIYNYINHSKLLFSVEEKKLKTIDKDYVIAIGRLYPVKQFDQLIDCYGHSKLPENNIDLIILGSGPEKEKLELCVSRLNLKNNVKLIAYNKHPNKWIKEAEALILSSKNEGFPLVLLEALHLNTPTIAFNCKSGPSEIIEHEVNGLLVEDQNQEQLTAALNKLLLDTSFYNKIKENTNKGLEKFSETKIIQKWVNLLESQI
jgi:N-acetylgalactosamine-N,N'-diacetylbacillosaminyl-diphospho-undecaprenol 4-alpha-N-acetylgalactosaminyltransferase